MGIRGGAKGFYQRRDSSSNKPQKPKEDETPEMVPNSSESPLESSIAVRDTPVRSGTVRDEQQGAAESTSMPVARTIIHMKKNAKLRKKRRSSKAFDMEDDSYAFGSKNKSRKETSSEVTPKSSVRKVVHSSSSKAQNGNTGQEETAKLPTVTPFVESDALTKLASIQVESEVPRIVHKKRASSIVTKEKGTEDWKSPHPFSQNSQSSGEEQAEEQQQGREQDTEDWKKKNSGKDTTARSLEEVFSIDKDKMEKEHAQALEDAVQRERARMEELFSEERKGLALQRDSLQKQVDKLHVKQEMNAKSLVDLACSQREGHVENERLKKEIRRLKIQLEASQSEVAALQQRREDFSRRDVTVTPRASFGASITEEEPKRVDERPHKRPSNRLITKTKPMAEAQQRDTQRQSPDARQSPSLSVNSKRRTPSPQKSNRRGSDSVFSFPSPDDNRSGNAIRPLQYKTQPGRRSSPKENAHQRKIHTLVPSYDFLHGYEVKPINPKKKKPEFKFKVED